MGFCEGSPVAFAVARRVQSEGEALPTGVPQVSLAILIAQSHNSGSVRSKPAGSARSSRGQGSAGRRDRRWRGRSAPLAAGRRRSAAISGSRRRYHPADALAAAPCSGIPTLRGSQVRNGLSAGGRWIRTSGSWSRDRQTVMGEVTAFSKPGADLLGNRRFESISLQQRVCEPSVPRRPSQPRSANAGQAHNRLGKDPARRVLHWSRISKSARPTSRHPNISAGYARRYWVRTTRQGARSASYRLW